MQDPEAYQRLLGLAARSEPAEGVRQGLEDASSGRTRPAQRVLDELRARHGVLR